jgi:hypothetical protein
VIVFNANTILIVRQLMLTTEFEFTLPRGLMDANGDIHRYGVMRLATAKDEIAVQKDRRAQQSEAYGILIMFSQVITKLGTISSITPEVLENLFSRDLGYLREFYNRINQQGNAEIAVCCPNCNNKFGAELVLSGES